MSRRPSLPVVLSQSALKSLGTCAEHYHWRYVERVRVARTSRALSIGAAFDAGVSALWLDRSLAEALAFADGCFDVFDRALVRAMLVGWAARWQGEPWKAIAVQPQFDFELPGVVAGRAQGKLDALLALPGVIATSNASAVAYELKTTSEDIGDDSPWWDRVAIDPQLALYLAGAESLGYSPTGVLYDVARKPAIRPRQAEDPLAFEQRCLETLAAAPEKYFVRRKITVTDETRAHVMADLRDAVRRIRDYTARGHWPRNTANCVQWGRPCDYLPICGGRSHCHDTDLYRIAEREHEELKP